MYAIQNLQTMQWLSKTIYADNGSSRHCWANKPVLLGADETDKSVDALKVKGYTFKLFRLQVVEVVNAVNMLPVA